MKQRKLLFFVCYMIIFAVASYRVKLLLAPGYEAYMLFSSTLLYASIYGYFTWAENLSNIFHLYLRFTRAAALKNLCLALIGETVVLFFFILGFQGIQRFNPVVLIVDPVLFLLSSLILYSWVQVMSFNGFFTGTILWISSKANQNLPMDWILDPHERKTIVYFPAEKLTMITLKDTLVKERVSEVVLLEDDVSSKEYESISQYLWERGVGYFAIKSRSFWMPNGKLDLRYLSRGYTNRDSLLNVSLKRIFDLVAGTMICFCLLPVFVLVALLIKLDDGGSVFYVSRRVGHSGRIIKFLKFRSMIQDAEKRKFALLAMNERQGGPLFKIRNDPRVTRIGRILRRFSLDELPQVINVLRGDLSLVGPRPHLESEVAHYEGFDYQRMDCVPGITCLAQIHDRNGLSFRDWIDLDLQYRREWSFSLDLLILARTVRVVLEPLVRWFKGQRVDIY